MKRNIARIFLAVVLAAGTILAIATPSRADDSPQIVTVISDPSCGPDAKKVEIVYEVTYNDGQPNFKEISRTETPVDFPCVVLTAKAGITVHPYTDEHRGNVYLSGKNIRWRIVAPNKTYPDFKGNVFYPTTNGNYGGKPLYGRYIFKAWSKTHKIEGPSRWGVNFNKPPKSKQKN